MTTIIYILFISSLYACNLQKSLLIYVFNNFILWHFLRYAQSGACVQCMNLFVCFLALFSYLHRNVIFMSESHRNGRRHKIDQTKRKRLNGNIVGHVMWMEEG